MVKAIKVLSFQCGRWGLDRGWERGRMEIEKHSLIFQMEWLP